MKAADYKGCVELNTKKSSLPKCNFFRKDNCLGEIKYSDGIYVGEILNKQANGQGTYTWTNGDKYTGEFKDNKINLQNKNQNTNKPQRKNNNNNTENY